MAVLILVALFGLIALFIFCFVAEFISACIDDARREAAEKEESEYDIIQFEKTESRKPFI